MQKGIAEVYIITLVLGTVAVGLLGYQLYTTGGGFSGGITRQQCLQAVSEYCTDYNPDRDWDTKYGNKPTKENCADYLAGRYQACLKFDDVIRVDTFKGGLVK